MDTDGLISVPWAGWWKEEPEDDWGRSCLVE
jgi:hypothetical protein